MSAPQQPESLAALLDGALRSRGMTLVELRRRLEARGHRVSLASLSYWRSGQRQPEAPSSLDALADIEDILDLPAARLRDARGPSRRPGPRLPSAPLNEVLPESIPVRTALRTLGIEDWQDHLDEDVVHIAIDLDDTGSMTCSHSRVMLRAHADGATHYPIVVYAGERLSAPLVMEAVHGADVTGRVELQSVGLTVWKLSLPRPLRIGETAIVETVVRLVDIGRPDEEYIHHVTNRVSELTVWLRFDPDCLPASCALFVQAYDDAATTMTPVDVSQDHNAHVSVRSFGPGRVGVLCTW